MEKPLVSVLMPVYNGAPFLKEAVESICGQTYGNFELIIIDDGSKDGSSDVIRDIKDQRIRLINNETNIGLASTLNKGIELSQGKYIARMDQDDISHSGRIDRQVTYMETHPETVACSAWFKMFGASEKQIAYPESHNEIYLRFLYSCPIAHPAVILRKETLVNNRLFYDPAYEYSEDSNLWIRMINFGEFHNLPEFLFSYRMHHSQMTKEYLNKVNESFRRSRNIHFRNMIQKLGFDANNYADFDMLPDQVSLADIRKRERIFEELMQKNKTLKIFDDRKLEETLGIVWKELVGKIPQVKVSELPSILASSFRRYANTSLRWNYRLTKKAFTR